MTASGSLAQGGGTKRCLGQGTGTDGVWNLGAHEGGPSAAGRMLDGKHVMLAVSPKHRGEEKNPGIRFPNPNLLPVSTHVSASRTMLGQWPGAGQRQGEPRVGQRTDPGPAGLDGVWPKVAQQEKHHGARCSCRIRASTAPTPLSSWCFGTRITIYRNTRGSSAALLWPRRALCQK